MKNSLFSLIVDECFDSGKSEVTEFFDEPLRGFVCERAAVQSAEFVLIQHNGKNSMGDFGYWPSLLKCIIVS